ncbi:MAG: metallophosphoesterase [Peptococcaceae bacterium]|nr:MAG: metallophosphoesterase [Peptococcaceae bacterium]
MKIAAISDIHGNLPALQAVLANIEKQGADRIFCAGDLVGYGPQPNEVIALLKEKRIPVVMGNYDDAAGFERIVCGCDYQEEREQLLGERSLNWTKENLAPKAKEFLQSLPFQLCVSVEALNLLVVHGSPRRLNEYLYEEFPESELIEMLAQNNADILVCGHTHLPYHRRPGDRHVINAGSAGRPKHGDPDALYALLEITGAAVRVELRKVGYDYEAAAKAIEQSGLPAEFAVQLRTGK